ncbi:CpsD/CapB family tyrosine-protein kinase [Amaricoccus solimangrovi]|uniref:CpsD/CapB family tyrosine-protein kinase n=1 Tax=Amaricoccus solimangrovi TaxID=2589815 RepID=A0A501WI22_9RHOB|nr:CpsD/CapB family tyrosine-protein kinase [Amaricoccus solimangrovi]TPE48432.1 CpsD/CapB family tyrosine-protein kinase [Amaricoccus solimangrovi]
MERIQAAIQKAKEQRGEALAAGASPAPGTATGTGHQAVAAARVARSGLTPAPGAGQGWGEIAAFEPDPRLMARNRIVTFADADPAHVTYDMMRTKLLRALRQNGWTSVGITSPTQDCGKTTTSLNLAFSLSHQPEVRTVLVDLDLRRPAVAKHLGLSTPQSMASVMRGTRPVAENFVRYGDNLAIGTNASGMRDSAELLLNPATAQGVASIRHAFAPDVILYDLPPMLQSDDVMAFLPHLDCVLLVAASEKSRLDEVDKCEQELAEQTQVLGVVLNKCRYGGEDYGYY